MLTIERLICIVYFLFLPCITHDFVAELATGEIGLSSQQTDCALRTADVKKETLARNHCQNSNILANLDVTSI